MRKYKVGCFVGKFLPPHIGHLSVINKMIDECENVVVVLAEDQELSQQKCKKVGFPYFSALKRLQWLRDYYKNYPNVNFVFFDEKGIDPKNYEMWSKNFKEKIPIKITAKYADASYKMLNEKYFPECIFVEIDRNKINIHGTDIRENLNNIKYVVPTGQQDILTVLKKGEQENE